MAARGIFKAGQRCLHNNTGRMSRYGAEAVLKMLSRCMCAFMRYCFGKMPVQLIRFCCTGVYFLRVYQSNAGIRRRKTKDSLLRLRGAARSPAEGRAKRSKGKMKASFHFAFTPLDFGAESAEIPRRPPCATAACLLFFFAVSEYRPILFKVHSFQTIKISGTTVNFLIQ